MEKHTVLTANRTLIPLGTVAVVFLCAMWLTTVWADGRATKQELAEFKITQAKNEDLVRQKLDRIEEKLDRLVDKIKK